MALFGAKVKILLDNGIMKHWDWFQIDSLVNIQSIEKISPNFTKNFKNYDYFHKRYYKNYLKVILERILLKRALKTYNDKNLEYIFYKDIIDKNNLNIENWQELKKYALSSTIRFFKNEDLDIKNNHKHRYYYYLSLKNAIISRDVGNYILNEIKFDYFIAGQGLYSTCRPAFEFLKKNGKKCLISLGHHGHLIENKRNFITDIQFQLLSSSMFWKEHKKRVVTEKMKKEVKKYFDYRLNGLSRDIKRHSLIEMTNLYSVKKNDGFKFHIAMFPNVIWDGNITDRHIAFDSYLDWLISTVNYIKNRTDIKLYIKAHPGEKFASKNTPGVLDLIKKYVDLEEVKNIVLLPPYKNFNTYHFLKSGIDLAIVYDGFLGIEAPYLKIPTITCVMGGAYSIEGWNVTVASKREYFHYLNNLGELIEEFHKNHYNKYYNNFVRYLYWYIYELPIDMPTNKTNIMTLKKKDIFLDKKLIDMLDN